MRAPHTLSLCAIGLLLTSCGTKPIQPSDHHMQRETTPAVAGKEIPQPITSGVVLPPPKPISKTATYSVVVTNVPAQQILFELARDAKINLDVHGGIDGLVTINAINQTLEQILSRIARQVDMRYELSNGSLIVMPDTPYLDSYKIDYVNMARDAESTISNSTQISSGSAGGSSGSSGGGAGNRSSIEIKDSSKNRFWETLTQNIKDILHETDKVMPAGSSETTVQQSKSTSSTGTGVAQSGNNTKTKIGVENSPNPVSVEEGDITVTKRSTFREAASVIANPENGLITVRATSKQHEKIRQFVDQIMSSARRQVLIEATVVEVKLNDQYQQGINWSALTLGAKGFSLTQAGTGIQPAATTGSMFLLNYANPTSKLGNLAASVSLLESFGNVKVLSSPKLSVLNNQTAMLRVVDNVAYFTTDVQIVLPTATTPGSNTYTTTLHSTPVGLTMSVTPQISDSDVVSLILKPSITRVIGTINDPNPALKAAGVVSLIPQTQTREMESVLRINNNQIAVMGGLMQDSIDKKTDSVPFLGSIPLIGNLFQNRNDVTTKSELVIFLHPVVIKDSSLSGDYSNFRNNLPDQEFFHESASGKQ